MTIQQEKQLNDFFVHVFNKINLWENQALTRIGAKDLSVKEIHVLAAVSEQAAVGQNTMTAIAGNLAIQVSSLTTAVGTLVKKGYLARVSDAKDRRLIRVVLTEKGEEANRVHTQFHAQMIHAVADRLSDAEMTLLTQSLWQLNHFFTDMIQIGDHTYE